MSIPPRDGFNEALEKLREIERQNKHRDHNHSAGQAGGTDGNLANGRLATGAGLSMSAANSEAIKSKEDEEEAFELAGKRALDRLNEWLAEIEALNLKIAALDEDIKVLDKDIGQLEKDMKTKYGPDWRVKAKEANDPSYILWLEKTQTRENKHQQKTTLEEKRDRTSDMAQEADRIRREEPEKFEEFMDKATPEVFAKMRISDVDQQVKDMGGSKFSEIHDVADLSVFSLECV